MIVVLGICHYCAEYTPLVKQEEFKKRLVYKCFHCHSQYEQMVNGKIIFQLINNPDEIKKHSKKIIDKLKKMQEEEELDVEFDPE